MSISPRQVFCVIEHRHRNRAIAEEICTGRFTIQGLSLDLGADPDWTGAPLPPDREWRLEWSKFYYGLDLASAFRATGDSRFPRAFERLVASWIDRVPIDFDPPDVIARRIQNWIYAWNGFNAARQFEGLHAGCAVRMVESIDAQVHHLRAHLTRERNHRTLELYALFISAVALPQLDLDGNLLAFAVEELHANLLRDILPDGVHRERSTHYHHVVLRSFLGMRENARRFGIFVPDGFDERLARACEFALHAHRPDGWIPALSDSDSGTYLDLLWLAGHHFSRPDFTYVASRGIGGTPPAATNASFPEGGYYVQRSGWGDGHTSLTRQRFLIFDCGPVGDGGHGHYDALNIEIAAEHPLVVDPGRYTYCDDAPHWRRRFKGTAAHNTVTVDGLDQTPYRRGRPKGAVASAVLLQRLEGRGIDVLCGEVRSPAYNVVHRRRVVFVAGEYWLIEDRLHSVNPHSYELRFHLAPSAEGHTSVNPTAFGATVHAPDVSFVLVTHGAVTLEDGWVAPQYGMKLPAPVIVASVRESAVAEFVTLVAPQTCVRSLPSLSLSDSESVRVATVHGVGAAGLWRDRVAWTADGTEELLSLFDCRAAAAWARECEGDRHGPHPATTVDVNARSRQEATAVVEVTGL